ncbi:SCO family protein [Pelagibius sp. 7325]|uniref:SCO family protein n=1 Tax=Pelagibius sp. 7325 TaxID=3131994 RepID=UPI0030EE2B4B
MRRFVLPLGLALAVTVPSLGLAHDPALHPPTKVEGPADDYVYELAAPGSYDLPRIRPAAAARLLDESGAAVELSALFAGRLTILAFMYTRCGDVCPLAALRLADLQRLAAEDAQLSQHLRIVSLSFDPAFDTPAIMAEYGAMMRLPDAAAPPWHFLTAPDRAAIGPVLAAYNQPVARKADPGDAAGPFSHLLRVFLIDSDGVIRNIYSADFLDPRLLMNDLKTLQMEAP